VLCICTIASGEDGWRCPRRIGQSYQFIQSPATVVKLLGILIAMAVIITAFSVAKNSSIASLKASISQEIRRFFILFP